MHVINTLSCQLHKQDPYYYETLDDDLVLTTPLPAPDVLWAASSAEEWDQAKSSCDERYRQGQWWNLQDAARLFHWNGLAAAGTNRENNDSRKNVDDEGGGGGLDFFTNRGSHNNAERLGRPPALSSEQVEFLASFKGQNKSETFARIIINTALGKARSPPTG